MCVRIIFDKLVDCIYLQQWLLLMVSVINLTRHVNLEWSALVGCSSIRRHLTEENTRKFKYVRELKQKTFQPNMCCTESINLAVGGAA